MNGVYLKLILYQWGHEMTKVYMWIGNLMIIIKKWYRPYKDYALGSIDFEPINMIYLSPESLQFIIG